MTRRLWAAELSVALIGRAAIERQVRVRRHEPIADLLAAKADRGATTAIEPIAVGMEAFGLPDAHADGGQAIGRDDGLDGVEREPEVADRAPDVAPLLVLGELPAVHEVGGGAESDQIVGEDRARALVVDGAAMVGERLEPGTNGGEIVGGDGRAELHGAILQSETLPVGALLERGHHRGPDRLEG